MTGLHERWETGDVNPNGERHLARPPPRRYRRAITATLLGRDSTVPGALRRCVERDRPGSGHRGGRSSGCDIGFAAVTCRSSGLAICPSRAGRSAGRHLRLVELALDVGADLGAISTNARAAGERWRSRCHTTPITRGGDLRARAGASFTRSSPGARRAAASAPLRTPPPPGPGPCRCRPSGTRSSTSKPRACSSPPVDTARARLRPDQRRGRRGRRARRSRAPRAAWSAGTTRTYGSLISSTPRTGLPAAAGCRTRGRARRSRSARRAPGRSSARRARARCPGHRP